MKFLFAVLFFTALALNVLGKALTEAERRELVSRNMAECQADPATRAPPEQLMKLILQEEVDVNVIGPYLICMAKKGHTMNDDGTLNIEEIKKGFQRIFHDDAEVDELMKKCVVQKSTEAETLVEMIKCVGKNKPRSL